MTGMTPSELDHGRSERPGKGPGNSGQTLKSCSGQEQFTAWYKEFHFMTV